MSSSTKKRRVGGDTPAAETDDNNNELIAMKSSIDELVHQNRTQNENITNLLQLMKGMQREMKDMRGEITQLRQKCNDLHNKQITNSADIKSGFDVVSAPRPSEEYWDSIEVEEDIDEAEDFLKQIQKYTEELRFGTVWHSSSTEEPITLEARLPYDEVFLPHWKEFANALESHRHYLKCISDEDGIILDLTHFLKLRLIDVALTEDIFDLLSNGLEYVYFHEFVLQNNELDQNGIEFVLNYLERNRICKQLALHRNSMSMDGIKRLGNIVKDHPSIKILGLSRCKDEDMDGYEMLKQIMTAGRNKLEVIDLSNNSINSRGDSFVSDFLANNPMLESLDLTDNELDDNDAVMIASALKRNTELRSLKMADNNITNTTGWEILSKEVFDKTSLNSAADSNHTCMIDFPSNHKYDHVRKINSDETSEVYYCPEYVRQKKIYTILSSRNITLTNVDHFDEDMPVELLPDILHSIQKYAGYHIPETDEDEEYTPPQDNSDVKPLSIVFEILQRWDKSIAVFEALSLYYKDWL